MPPEIKHFPPPAEKADFQENPSYEGGIPEPRMADITARRLALPERYALGFAMDLRIQTVDQHLEAILGLNAVQEQVPEQVPEHMRQFMEDITSQVRQLSLENQFLKQRLISLENTTREQNIALHNRIARLEMKFEASAEPRCEEYRSLATQKKQLRDPVL